MDKRCLLHCYLCLLPWLKDLYVSELQEKELNLALEKEHYDVTEISLERTPDMQTYTHPVPDLVHGQERRK